MWLTLEVVATYGKLELLCDDEKLLFLTAVSLLLSYAEFAHRKNPHLESDGRGHE
jgi:hypothetical protein